jgi:hypothetical protein
MPYLVQWILPVPDEAISTMDVPSWIKLAHGHLDIGTQAPDKMQ